MRIAVTQSRAILADAEAACDAIAGHLQWAADRAVDLLLLPEAFLLGHSFDAATIAARAEQASRVALPALCRRVASSPVTLVVGTFEVVDGRVFNSAFVIEAGRIVGRYAKAHPNEPGVVAGSDFPTLVRNGLRFGINICNDANHPAAAARIADQGASLILYPLNNMLRPATAARWREKSLANLVDRARQTGCWIASADVTGAAGELLSYGCTAVVAPDGTVVARVPELSEGIAIHAIPPQP